MADTNTLNDDLIDQEYGVDQPELDFNSAPGESVDDFGEPEIEEYGEMSFDEPPPIENPDDESISLDEYEKQVTNDTPENLAKDNSEDRLEVKEDFSFESAKKELSKNFASYNEFIITLLGEASESTGKSIEKKFDEIKSNLTFKKDFEEKLVGDFESSAKHIKESFNKKIDDIVSVMNSRKLPDSPPLKSVNASPGGPQKKSSTFGILSIFVLVGMISASGFFALDVTNKLNQEAQIDKRIEEKLKQADAIEKAIIVLDRKKRELEYN